LLKNITCIENGDGIVLNTTEKTLCFNLQNPLKLSDIQTNATQVIIIVQNTLEIMKLFGNECAINIESGSISFGADLSMSLQGNVTMGDIYVDTFKLQSSSTLKVSE